GARPNADFKGIGSARNKWWLAKVELYRESSVRDLNIFASGIPNWRAARVIKLELQIVNTVRRSAGVSQPPLVHKRSALRLYVRGGAADEHQSDQQRQRAAAFHRALRKVFGGAVTSHFVAPSNEIR